MNKDKICPRCRKRHVDSTKSGKMLDYCSVCQNERTVEKQQAFKKACVQHKGGQCTHCGYSHYQGALCLPVKEDLRKGKQYKKMASLTGTLPLSKKVEDELSQRDILCMNCYRATLSKKDNVVKRQLVLEQGGRCSVCNKVFRPISMDFHHTDGAGAPTKSLTIGSRTAKRDLPALQNEVRKCVLICSNCHLEHHYNERKEKNAMTNESVNLEAKASVELQKEVESELSNEVEEVAAAELIKKKKGCCQGKCKNSKKECKK